MLMDSVVHFTPVCTYIECIINEELARVTKKHFPWDILFYWSIPFRCCAAGFQLLCQLRLRVAECRELRGNSENLADLPTEICSWTLK